MDIVGNNFPVFFIRWGNSKICYVVTQVVNTHALLQQIVWALCQSPKAVCEPLAANGLCCRRAGQEWYVSVRC